MFSEKSLGKFFNSRYLVVLGAKQLVAEHRVYLDHASSDQRVVKN